MIATGVVRQLPLIPDWSARSVAVASLARRHGSDFVPPDSASLRWEYAYDRQSHVDKLDKALDAAAANKWTVADMKKDWKRAFAFE